MRLDARIPVHLAETGREPRPDGDAVLLRVGGRQRPAPDGWAAAKHLSDAAIVLHAAACACCSGRSGLAAELALLFVQRARAELPLFSRIVLSAPPGSAHDIATILRDDSMVAGRYRYENKK